jgi:3-oxoacyl-[acyl-carrier protein] reductase
MDARGSDGKRVALVTGASRGIGRAVAVELARQGCFVVAAYGANDDAAKATLEAIEAGGGHGALLKFDVGDPTACARVVEEQLAVHGRLDVLVNNAAVAIDTLLVRLKNEDWQRTLDVNLTGPMALCRAAARPMMKQRGGAIVNVVSVVGEMGNAGQTAYAAAKAGLVGLTKSLARELASRNVRVNAVSPGFIDTDMTSRLPDAVRDGIRAQVPMGRLGTAEEVASAVAFLASPAASYVTGEVLRVNGGLLT